MIAPIRGAVRPVGMGLAKAVPKRTTHRRHHERMLSVDGGWFCVKDRRRFGKEVLEI